MQQQILISLKEAASGGGFPVVLSVTTSAFITPATSHAVNMPASVDAGDLLIAAIASDGSNAGSAVATPSGWTSLGSAFNADASNRGSHFYKVAAGTEGGTTVDFVTTDSEELAAAIVRVEAGTYSAEPVHVIQQSTETSTPAAPSLSPSWGAADTLWIATLLMGRAPPSGFPLPDNQTTANGMSSGSTGAALGLCARSLNTATLSPGNWTQAAAIRQVVGTIAVRPA